jgi:hypothetical protein
MIDAGHSRRLSDTSKYRIVQLSSFSPFLPTDSFSHLRRPHTTLWNMTPMLDRCDANIITTLIMQAANQALPASPLAFEDKRQMRSISISQSMSKAGSVKN